LNYRFRRLRAIGDLDRAIATLSGIHRTNIETKDYAKAQLNLSMSYYEHYQVSESRDDIDAAIRAAEETIASASKTDREYVLYLSALGSALEVRFVDFHEVRDLERSIKFHNEALKLAASSGITLAGFQCNLANALADRFFYAKEERDALVATDLYREASKEGLQRTPEYGLNAAHSWMYFAYRRRKWHEVVEAYDFAAPMQEQLQRLQAERSHKEAWLRGDQGFSVIATVALTALGRAHRAVGVLEAGRVRLLSEVLEREHPAFDRLTQLGRIDLVRRYHEAVLKFKNEVAQDIDVLLHLQSIANEGA
jgi:tetratricopeptide (TPR) repeat protein